MALEVEQERNLEHLAILSEKGQFLGVLVKNGWNIDGTKQKRSTRNHFKL